ncbi:hypothetical protein CLV63_106164 [Murinocardiopsis flavida]|uniref:Uncharacterized protein n=1 Tax=Murinocardiopsis flavida TaxID=645275 RepID=A0A2P8DLL2_9ACTN|nr:hypothetical protein [Murinocardiopsis flavida]PSK98116.1 hypothetical protein CLV63_106164 [Murinocardiopsis flavida]
MRLVHSAAAAAMLAASLAAASGPPPVVANDNVVSPQSATAGSATVLSVKCDRVDSTGFVESDALNAGNVRLNGKRSVQVRMGAATGEFMAKVFCVDGSGPKNGRITVTAGAHPQGGAHTGFGGSTA